MMLLARPIRPEQLSTPVPKATPAEIGEKSRYELGTLWQEEGPRHRHFFWIIKQLRGVEREIGCEDQVQRRRNGEDSEIAQCVVAGKGPGLEPVETPLRGFTAAQMDAFAVHRARLNHWLAAFPDRNLRRSGARSRVSRTRRSGSSFTARLCPWPGSDAEPSGASAPSPWDRLLQAETALRK